MRPDGEFFTYEYNLDQMYEFVEHNLLRMQSAVVICESFIISQATIRKSQATWSLELIGLLRLLARKTKFQDLQLQTPSEAKSFMTDRKLKALNIWPSSDHERDAARHLILWLIRRGYFDVSIFEGVQAASS